MESPTSDSRHDRMAVRLSVIISRLLSGEALVLKSLSEVFGVSERTLRRDLHQRLIHLDIRNDDGVYRLSESRLRDRSPGALSFIRASGSASCLTRLFLLTEKHIRLSLFRLPWLAIC